MDFWFGFGWLIRIWQIIYENVGVGDVIGTCFVIILAIGFVREMD